MAHDVFISYSSKDKPTADAACALLESMGIRCWIAPRDVQPGSDWSEAIVDAIAASGVMVLIFSDNANRSPQVRREVEQAVSREVTLVPFRIENVPPCKSLQYFISVPHWMDAWNGPLERHLAQLAGRVSAILRPGSDKIGPGPVAKPGRRGTAGTVPTAGFAWPQWALTGRARRFRAVGKVALVGLKIGAIVAAFIFFFGRIPIRLHWAAAGVGPAGPIAIPAAVPASPASPAPFAPPRDADADADRKAQAIEAAQAAAQSMRLMSVAVIGRERVCVIDSTRLREGDSYHDFVVQEIQTDRVVLSREGAQFEVHLKPPTN